jgi:hypothetical protein
MMSLKKLFRHGRFDRCGADFDWAVTITIAARMVNMISESMR